MRNAIIHIGHGKTGTSAVQAWLKNNSEILKAHNFKYLKTGITGDSHVQLAALKGLISSDLKEQLRDEVSKLDSISPIISSEALYYSTPENIKTIASILNDYKCKIILYVRPQEYMISSAYLQWLRANRLTDTAQEFYQKHNYVYKYIERAQAFCDVFKSSELVVKYYRTSNNFDVVTSFCELLGFEAEDQYNKKVNLSIPSILAEELRSLNETSIDETERSIKLQEMSTTGHSPAVEPSVHFSKEELFKLRKFYWEDNFTISKLLPSDESRDWLEAVKPY